MKPLLFALLLVAIAWAAHAQNATGLVVSTCGTVPNSFATGNPAPFTVDTNGQLCDSGTGIVSASPTTGTGNKTGLGVGTCGSATFNAGNPGPFTVDQYGRLCD